MVDRHTGGGRRSGRALWLLAILAALLLFWRGLLALYPYPYAALIHAAAQREGLDPLLILAVIRSESGFRPGSTSHSGARGLMQVLPETGQWVAGRMPLPGFDPEQLYDPAVNISVGSWYLASLRRQFGGRTVTALAAYNAGADNVERWLQGRLWSGGASDLDRIPYPETRSFVRHVLGSWRVYRVLYRRPAVGGGGGAGGGVSPPPPAAPATSPSRTPS